mmetsp:Transcript_21936/g.65779  ORF Transcript_21936/g.65779 Transcript_21936/m.65779 type:complete len:288 (+) Transcript_21936:2447-3310(+)
MLLFRTSLLLHSAASLRRHTPRVACRGLARHAAAASEPASQRLDSLLLERGLVASRSQATALIKSGGVAVDAKAVTKPGARVSSDAAIEVSETTLTRYVSRGGEKLHAAFERWPALVPEGKRVLDVGASTGGFTDCCLRFGAAAVDAVDVGKGQMKVEDPRLRSFEGVNCRHAEEVAALPLAEAYDLVVMDLSFISLELVLPVAWRRCGRDLVCLVKPQFELGKEVVAKGRGVVRDPAQRQRALDGVWDFCWTSLPDCEPADAFQCPVHEEKGNREFLLHLRRNVTR